MGTRTVTDQMACLSISAKARLGTCSFIVATVRSPTFSLGKSLLLFRKTADGVRFEGEMVYEGHHVERAPDRTGVDRNAIVFELRPLEAIAEIVEAEGPPPGATLEDLRQRALTAAAGPSQPSTQGVRMCINAAGMLGITFWPGPTETARVVLCRRHSFDQMEIPTLSRIICAGSVMEDPIIPHT